MSEPHPASHVAPLTLWVCPVSNLAGVARHIIDVARVGLPGWRLVVAAPEGPLLDELRGQGCPVVPLNVDRSVPGVVTELRDIVTKLAPAIVHSHLARADFLATMATVGLPTILVSTEHHIPEEPLALHNSRAKALSRQAAHHMRIRRFDHLLAVSDSTKRDMLRYWRPTAPITVVKNGVERPEHAPERTPGLRLLSLTRLDREKNLEMTLRVFAGVLAKQPQATLTIGGTGPQESALRRLADDLGVAHATTFAGFVDARRALQGHDVLLQPSRADNLSYTLLDAVAAGMGVVASSIGGNPEILPVHALVSLDDDADMVGAVIEQGLDLTKRPELPESIPTVQGMVNQVVDVYADLGFGDAKLAKNLEQPVSDSTPLLSVVTAYYRNQATFGAQLDALAAQVDAPPFEVIIADNEGSARLPRIVAPYRQRLDIRIVPATDRRGQCHARNVGVQEARAKLLALCDADDIVAPTWVAALHDALEAEDALVTGPLQLDRINPEYAWRTYLGVDASTSVPSPVEGLPYEFLGYASFAVGCNLGIRKETFHRLGGMDETMLGGSEDVDFSWRALEAGIPLVVDPDAVVDYRLRTGVAAVFRQRRAYQRSQLKLWNKSIEQGRPVRGMSLRWALTESAKLPGEYLKCRGLPHESRYAFAARAGAVLGNLEGQVRERALKR